MEENRTNQWELEGDCSICRRKNYCSKPCTRCKRETHKFLIGAAVDALDRRTGGAYSATMNAMKGLGL